MKLRKSFAIVFCALLSLAANAAERDEFFWLGEMNKATAVINSEEGLLDKAVTPKIARGIEEVITNGSKPGAKRPKTRFRRIFPLSSRSLSKLREWMSPCFISEDRAKICTLPIAQPF